MTREQVVALFEGITRGRTAGGRRAPHKPLLLLYALARFADGEKRLRYNEVETRVRGLIRDFGPAAASDRVHYPFWRLQGDRLWVVEEPLVTNAAGDVRRTELVDRDSVGRFSDEVAEVFHAEPGLVGELLGRLLAREFTEAYDDEILTAIGFDPAARETAPKRRRDPAFRRRVLEAYEYRCAVCGFSAHVGDAHVGLDAAHVKWHQYGGPDEVKNGLALCALHHRLLDRGAFTVAASSSRERVVAVSEAARGNEGFERWMLAYHGRTIASPVRSEYRVAEPMTAWHAREVFKGRPRT